MTFPTEPDTKPQLVRGIGLGSATALNMIDMIGVGPFITIPLIVTVDGRPAGDAGMGAGRGAGDLRRAGVGGTRRGHAGVGRVVSLFESRSTVRRSWDGMVSFLFIWQLSFSAPLSIASGAVGLSQYAAFFWPGLERVWSTRTWSTESARWLELCKLTWVAMPATLLAIGVCAFTAFLAVPADHGDLTARPRCFGLA